LEQQPEGGELLSTVLLLWSWVVVMMVIDGD
jgi:hypothetical protein